MVLRIYHASLERVWESTHFWEGLDWGESWQRWVFQEKAEIGLCRAMLVSEAVHRAPSL